MMKNITHLIETITCEGAKAPFFREELARLPHNYVSSDIVLCGFLSYIARENSTSFHAGILVPNDRIYRLPMRFSSPLANAFSKGRHMCLVEGNITPAISFHYRRIPLQESLEEHTSSYFRTQ